MESAQEQKRFWVDRDVEEGVPDMNATFAKMNLRGDHTTFCFRTAKDKRDFNIYVQLMSQTSPLMKTTFDSLRDAVLKNPTQYPEHIAIPEMNNVVFSINESSSTMALFIQFVLYGKLPEELKQISQISNLTELWVFGSKYQIPRLQNVAMKDLHRSMGYSDVDNWKYFFEFCVVLRQAQREGASAGLLIELGRNALVHLGVSRMINLAPRAAKTKRRAMDLVGLKKENESLPSIPMGHLNKYLVASINPNNKVKSNSSDINTFMSRTPAATTSADSATKRDTFPAVIEPELSSSKEHGDGIIAAPSQDRGRNRGKKDREFASDSGDEHHDLGHDLRPRTSHTDDDASVQFITPRADILPTIANDTNVVDGRRGIVDAEDPHAHLRKRFRVGSGSMVINAASVMPGQDF